MERLKTKRLRFTYNDDLSFLREVVTENPFDGDLNLWENIQRNLEIATGKLFTIKTLKNHLELLLEVFLKKDVVDKVRSGVEEPYCERDHLLQEVAIISSEYRENNLKKKKQASKEKQISDLGKKAREKYSSVFTERNEILCIESEDAIETLTYGSEEIVPYNDHTYVKAVNSETPNALELVQGIYTVQGVVENSKETDENLDVLPKNKDASTPPLKKNVIRPSRTRPRKEATLRKNAITYLTEKHEKDRQIKEKELELEGKKIELENKKLLLEEEKLKLEIKKVELQTKEREEKLNIEKQKWSMEMEEKKVTSQLLLAQQKIINNFVKDMSF